MRLLGAQVHHITDIDDMQTTIVVTNQQTRGCVKILGQTHDRVARSQIDTHSQTKRCERRFVFGMQLLIGPCQSVIDFAKHRRQQLERHNITGSTRRCCAAQRRRTRGCPGNIDTNTDDNEAVVWGANSEETAEFLGVDHQIIRPLQCRGHTSEHSTGCPTGECHHSRETKHVFVFITEQQ